VIRDDIQSDLPEPGQNPKQFFFKLSGAFSPLTELAAVLLKLFRKAHGRAMTHAEFRGQFLRMITAEDPGRYAAEFWDLPELDRHRINAMVTSLDLLPIAFSNLVFSEDEVATIEPRHFIRILYRFLLDRDPDADGLRQWAGSMQQGMSPKEIVQTFSDSEEVRANGNGRSVMVLGEIPADLAPLVSQSRQLQDVELSRIYDLASLIALIEE
jgi:hypothetical protein